MKRIAILTSIPAQYLWRDGLYEALELLKKDYELAVFLNGARPIRGFTLNTGVLPRYDMVIGWGAFGSSEAKYVSRLKGVKKGLFWAASHGHAHPLAHKFDLLMVEDQNAVREFAKIGVEAKLCFGVNTKLFKPIKQKILFDAIHVGAYAVWKRKKLFAEAVQTLTAISVGILQEVERDEFYACQKAGVLTLPNVPQEFMPYYYASASCVAVTGWAGSQRTVLEALAMGKQCIVPSDALQLLDYSEHVTVVEPTAGAFKMAIIEAEKGNPKGRKEVLEKYSHKNYYEQIKRGIKKCLA